MLGYPIRRLARSPRFTVLAVAILAVGIGANTVVFSLANSLLFSPLAGVTPDRLVRVGATRAGDGFMAFSYPEFRDLRDGSQSFQGLLAHQPNTIVLRADGDPWREQMEIVTANYFSVLGVSMLAGRGFAEDDESPGGAQPSVVISHRLWQRRFGGDRSVVGRVVRLNGAPFAIIGIAPSEFRGTFPGFAVNAWVPLSAHQVALPRSGSMDRRGDRFLMLFGRLRPGVSRQQAQAELDVVASRFRDADPSAAEARMGIALAGAEGIHPLPAGIVGAFLGLLQGIVGLLLVIVAANLASLVLARASVERREVAIRTALGATRGRLMGLVLAESLVLSAAGGSLGSILAFWTGRLLERIELPSSIPLVIRAPIDLSVLAFTAMTAAATAVLFGLLPAWLGSRASALGELRATSTTAPPGRARFRRLLIGLQTAVATVLLVGAGLAARSLANTGAVDPGFDARNLTILEAAPELLGYDDDRSLALWTDAARRITQLPGVEGAALATFVPLGDRSDNIGLLPSDDPSMEVPVDYNIVDPGYFDLLAIPVRAGRTFGDPDRSGVKRVVIVSESFARRFLPPGVSVGRTITLRDRADSSHRLEVVGVVGDVKYRSLSEAPRPLVYVPYGQWRRPDMVLHIKSPMVDARTLVEIVRGLNPDLEVRVRALEAAQGFSLIPIRTAGAVLGFAGLAGLVLTLIGVMGVVSYLVSQRLREIGIRMALGAAGTRVALQIMAQGTKPVVWGLLLGLALAVPATGLIRSFLIGVAPAEPATMASVALGLLGATALAAFLPARAAARVDPATVLRSE